MRKTVMFFAALFFCHGLGTSQEALNPSGSVMSFSLDLLDYDLAQFEFNGKSIYAQVPAYGKVDQDHSRFIGRLAGWTFYAPAPTGPGQSLPLSRFSLQTPDGAYLSGQKAWEKMAQTNQDPDLPNKLLRINQRAYKENLNLFCVAINGQILFTHQGQTWLPPEIYSDIVIPELFPSQVKEFQEHLNRWKALHLDMTYHFTELEGPFSETYFPLILFTGTDWNVAQKTLASFSSEVMVFSKSSPIKITEIMKNDYLKNIIGPQKKLYGKWITTKGGMVYFMGYEYEGALTNRGKKLYLIPISQP